jgi:hypothetical protein
MPTILKTKNSVTTTVVPTTLQQGELAVNITDKKMWVGNAATTPVQILGAGVTNDAGGSNTQVQYNSSGVLAGSANLTFNGTILTSTGFAGPINGTVGATTANTGLFTTLGATGVATFSAGTVSAPAITTTGDTNTGIFFPAADTIAFTEGGAESMRIDSGGNVGLGVTPSAWVGFTAMQFGGQAYVAGSSLGMGMTSNAYRDAGGFKYIATSGAALYAQASGNSHAWYTAPSGTAGNAITFTQAMTLNASGNLLLGTTSQLRSGLASFAGSSSSVNQLVLADTNAYNASPTVQQTFTFKSNTAGTYVDGGFIRVTKANATDGNTLSNMTFATNTGSAAVEAMRIDSSGNVLIGKTSATANGGDLQVSSGITFPATQVAKSDANTLDDYEEGTFTPTVQGVSSAGTATYSAQDGKYTKIGNLVYVNVYLTYTGGTGTGQLAVGGLPFTSASSPIAVPSIYLDGVTFTAGYYPQAILNTNGTRIDFYQTQGGASFSINYDAAATILLSLTYRV